MSVAYAVGHEDTEGRPSRAGIPVNFSLDHDAHAILHALRPHKKGFGVLVSELLRKEFRERLQRAEQLAAMASVID